MTEVTEALYHHLVSGLHCKRDEYNEISGPCEVVGAKGETNPGVRDLETRKTFMVDRADVALVI